jgi:tetratricopeptide (TPR) repeat protein
MMSGQREIEAIPHAIDALRLARPEDGQALYRANLALGNLCQTEGAFVLALPLYRRALAAARHEGDALAASRVIQRMASAQAWQAHRLHLLGLLDDETLKQAIVGVQSGMQGEEAVTQKPDAFDHITLATLLMLRADYRAAEALLQVWRDRIDAKFYPQMPALAASSHALCRMQLGDRAAALALCEEARACMQEQGYPLFHIRTLHNVAEVLNAAGHPAGDETMRRAAEALREREDSRRRRLTFLEAQFRQSPLAELLQAVDGSPAAGTS